MGNKSRGRPQPPAETKQKDSGKYEKREVQKKVNKTKARVINAEGSVFGRLASMVAKELLGGAEIVIVNAEKSIVAGSRKNILEEYKTARARGSRERGPYFPKRPDLVLGRAIRGMLPYKAARGRDAISRLKIFIGVPEEYKSLKAEKIKEAGVARDRFMLLGEVSKEIGWTR
jgi:large subunit ribosomal protein L13